jgi:hypothetical protein
MEIQSDFMDYKICETETLQKILNQQRKSLLITIEREILLKKEIEVVEAELKTRGIL